MDRSGTDQRQDGLATNLDDIRMAKFTEVLNLPNS